MEEPDRRQKIKTQTGDKMKVHRDESYKEIKSILSGMIVPGHEEGSLETIIMDGLLKTGTLALRLR